MLARTAAALTAVALAASAHSAWAADYSFSFDNGQVSGTLTTDASGQAPQQIVDISGSAFGEDITGLLGIGAYAGNNNILYPANNSSTNGYLDIDGFSFSTADSQQNIYRSAEYIDFVDSPGAEPHSFGGDFTLAPAVSAAPEPGTWALMFAGVAMLGAALRFRRRETGQVAIV